ncbi:MULTISPECIES: ATP-binding protein [Xenorhabdus]|uniref:ATP-binding protein n=1 Tax=Xenorhabdus TaxID=626 RepID=UPI0006494487|nr:MULTISPECIES: ATP-binding protein [Xenorhabdus]KLU16262.1 hypothetical protein AAY47_06685 [Xenorhabdus griffiniae]KOP32343.1 hypothetical protein AFK69_15730 [Xenorhabdus sp. GDc328]
MIKKIKIHGYRIYKELVLTPNTKLNIIVGDNEAGKSTLLEAIVLALTGRINGRSASEEFNSHWFNTDFVNDFLLEHKKGERVSFPEISIELFFDNQPDLQALCGAINSDVPTTACPSVVFSIIPDPEYVDELDEWLKEPSPLLPGQPHE